MFPSLTLMPAASIINSFNRASRILWTGNICFDHHLFWGTSIKMWLYQVHDWCRHLPTELLSLCLGVGDCDMAEWAICVEVEAWALTLEANPKWKVLPTCAVPPSQTIYWLSEALSKKKTAPLFTSCGSEDSVEEALSLMHLELLVSFSCEWKSLGRTADSPECCCSEHRTLITSTNGLQVDSYSFEDAFT